MFALEARREKLRTPVGTVQESVYDRPLRNRIAGNAALAGPDFAGQPAPTGKAAAVAGRRVWRYGRYGSTAVGDGRQGASQAEH